MTRFCVWGGRPHDVWIGSPQDRALQRRRARERERMRRMAEQLEHVAPAIKRLGMSAVSATTAFARIGETLRRMQSRERRRARAQWPLWRDYETWRA